MKFRLLIFPRVEAFVLINKQHRAKNIFSRDTASRADACNFICQMKKNCTEETNFKFKYELRFQRPFNPLPFPNKVTISKLSPDLVDSLLVSFEAQSPITRLKETDGRTPRDFRWKLSCERKIGHLFVLCLPWLHAVVSHHANDSFSARFTKHAAGLLMRNNARILVRKLLHAPRQAFRALLGHNGRQKLSRSTRRTSVRSLHELQIRTISNGCRTSISYRGVQSSKTEWKLKITIVAHICKFLGMEE